jgi:hypothetical protein
MKLIQSVSTIFVIISLIIGLSPVNGDTSIDLGFSKGNTFLISDNINFKGEIWNPVFPSDQLSSESNFASALKSIGYTPSLRGEFGTYNPPFSTNQTSSLGYQTPNFTSLEATLKAIGYTPSQGGSLNTIFTVPKIDRYNSSMNPFSTSIKGSGLN